MSDSFPLICRHCGTKEQGHFMEGCRQELIARQACFSCNFWLEKVEWREAGDPNAVVGEDFVHYHIGEASNSSRGIRGFGGREFTIQFHDGRVVKTSNLWCQGSIPEGFRDRLPPNATLRQETSP